MIALVTPERMLVYYPTYSDDQSTRDKHRKNSFSPRAASTNATYDKSARRRLEQGTLGIVNRVLEEKAPRSPHEVGGGKQPYIYCKAITAIPARRYSSPRTPERRRGAMAQILQNPSPHTQLLGKFPH